MELPLAAYTSNNKVDTDMKDFGREANNLHDGSIPCWCNPIAPCVKGRTELEKLVRCFTYIHMYICTEKYDVQRGTYIFMYEDLKKYVLYHVRMNECTEVGRGMYVHAYYMHKGW